MVGFEVSIAAQKSIAIKGTLIHRSCGMNLKLLVQCVIALLSCRWYPKMKIALPLVAFLVAEFLFLAAVSADEINAKVYNPADVYPPTYSPEFAGKPVIYDFIKPLILHMQEPLPNDFISSPEAKQTLFWRLQHIIIVSGDIVTARFSEGHADVIGVFVRNVEAKRWELKTQVGGHFKYQYYDETTGKPILNEQPRTDQSATTEESKPEDGEKTQPKSKVSSDERRSGFGSGIF